MRSDSDWPSDHDLAELVLRHIGEREVVRDTANIRSNLMKMARKDRHDKGITNVDLNVGDLVMLYDPKTAGKKLRPSWRGPFQVIRYHGDHQISYRIQQLNGKSIAHGHLGDQLKLFIPRTGYLVTEYERLLPEYQNIRASRASRELPNHVTSGSTCGISNYLEIKALRRTRLKSNLHDKSLGNSLLNRRNIDSPTNIYINNPVEIDLSSSPYTQPSAFNFNSYSYSQTPLQQLLSHTPIHPQIMNTTDGDKGRDIDMLNRDVEQV